MYIGHRGEQGKCQALSDHLANVSNIAGRFGAAFNAEAHARRTGTLHDAGKYSPAAQRRMADPEHTPKVDHSTAGAKIALEQCRDGAGALAIAGHHGGMPDFGGRLASAGDGTLLGRMKKDLSGPYDYAAFWQENDIDKGMLLPGWLMEPANPFAGQFYIRMLFSCLVDADFLDTEQYLRGETPRGGYDDMPALLDRFQRYIQPWIDHPATEINQKRCEILRDCLRAGEGSCGLYTLTVPTGGGKTLSSLAFALTHAVKNNLKHIIYVIPYTSIIEQNAAVFKGVLGEDNVIEHHAGIDYGGDGDMERPEVMRQMLATENWDAPVIVTTAVQFFESLFSNKPSRCRKLHNIASSVVIFDEAQMLPLSCLKPCVSAIAELVRHYRTTAVLCTATQPSLARLFHDYDATIDSREICEKPGALQSFFRRVHFVRKEAMDCATLARHIGGKAQILCIVNTRRTAQEVFSLLPGEGCYHLSTRMTPEHRSKVLDEVRKRLRDGLTCRVVSTSLIEAGVDVDFPEVWRETAGLDSILQAAGRCNREGRRDASASEVVVFSLDRGVPKGMRPNAIAAEIAMEGADYIDESPVIRRYFDQLYWQQGDQAMDAKDMMKLCAKPNMKTIAEGFHLIESDTRTIYIPSETNAEDIRLLRLGILSRSLMRRLARSAVSVYPWDWQKLIDAGTIERLTEGTAVLTDQTAYDPCRGLTTDAEPGQGLWI